MRYLISSLFLFVVFTACQNAESNLDLEKARVTEFTNTIVNGLKESHPAVLDLHLDKTAFVNRVVNDNYWDEQLNLLGNTNYKENYKTQLLQEMSLARMFLSGIEPQQYFAYDLSKIYEIDGRWHAVFRIYANTAINYHDYLLRVDSSKVWIEDVYIMTIGNQLSKVMQEVYIAGIPSANNATPYRDFQLVGKAKRWMAQKNYSMAIATFDSLSSAYKSQKSMRLFWLQISANIPDEAYIRAIENYEKTYPNDAGTLLLQLDKNFMFGNYPEVLRGLDRLEKMYGKDPIVDFLRGNANYGLGKCALAADYFSQASALKKDWVAPWQNRMECWIRNDRYEEAIPLLDTLVARFDYTPTYCKYVLSDYPNFLNSSTFRNWRAKLEIPES
jgi:hypothetical protein